ncbi:hypothetical protein [Salana multivorans]
MTRLRAHRAYTDHNGTEYPIVRDRSGWLLVHEGARAPTKEWRRHDGRWVRRASPDEVARGFRVSYRGSYRGVRVEAQVDQDGRRVLLWTTLLRAAVAVGMEQSDKGEARLEVEMDDPGLSLTEVRTPLRRGR